MTRKTLCGATALCALAGTALAQPVIDGKLDTDGSYGVIRWANRIPTGFGDNNPNNVPPSGNPQDVYTGVEFKIPLASIGNPGGDVKITAYISSGDFGYSSNQWVGGLGGSTGNIGEPRNIDMNNFGGNQYVTVSGTTGNSISVDGTAEGNYGSALSTQNTFTGFGDATQGLVDYAQGSEIDQIFAVKDATYLYVTIAGNFEGNGNQLCIFIDSAANAGQNTLRGDNTNGGLNRQGDDGNGNGLTFDSAFEPDFFIAANAFDPDGTGATPTNMYVNFAEILSSGGGVSEYLGAADAVSGGTLNGGNNIASLELTFNNSNIQGVTGSPSLTLPSPDDAVGSEIDNMYFTVVDDRLYMFIGGNLQTSYNKMNLFIDAISDEGQNTLRSDQVDIDFGRLNNMQGLTFDSGFGADMWIGFTNGGYNPVEIYSNAAVLRTDGPRTDINGSRFDYGCYNGGQKPGQQPINYDGPRLDIQDGSSANVFAEYAPRLAGDSLFADPFNPVGTPGLIEAYIDNSNIAGVQGYPDGDWCDASNVTTGFEFSVRLDELGWDGNSPIRVAGFISSDSYDYISNQVLGGLPDGTGNLATTADVNFANIDGNQFIVITCPSDFNGDGFVTGDDFDEYVAAFELGDISADFNRDCFVTGDDFDTYVALFEQGC